MKNTNFMLQVLPILTVTLCIVFFIIIKILSRIRHQAQGNPDGSKLSEFKLATADKMPPVERLKLECPAVIERGQGFTRVGIKELSLNGAFVTCPLPLAIGEAFQIKIFFEKKKSLTLQADVIWNNNNVPRDQIVARGMKVRFLQLTEVNRQFLKEMLAVK
jgi:hypothetical protein